MGVGSGNLAVRALAQAGAEHVFTLSGAHIFPLYEGARDAGVRLVDTRHEQTAVFGAERLAELTRRRTRIRRCSTRRRSASRRR